MSQRRRPAEHDLADVAERWADMGAVATGSPAVETMPADIPDSAEGRSRVGMRPGKWRERPIGGDSLSDDPAVSLIAFVVLTILLHVLF